jgi:indole-3-acetate monooxygenase
MTLIEPEDPPPELAGPWLARFRCGASEADAPVPGLIRIKVEPRYSRVQYSPRFNDARIGAGRGRFWQATRITSRVRALGPALAEAVEEIDRNRELPRLIVSALIDNGLFRLLHPRSLGAAELDPMTYLEVVEQIASHDASTALCIEQANGCSRVAAFLDREAAQEIFGPPDGIAWGPVGPAELSVVPGGFRLTGAWNFASGSHHASWLGAHVVVRGPDGLPRCRADGGEILRTLLFPKSRATMTDIWHVVGVRGTGSDRYSVSDLFNPERHTVVRDPGIAPREPGRLYSFSSSVMYGLGVAGVALGIARGIITALSELATEKVPRGARQSMRKSGGPVAARASRGSARLAHTC